MSSPTAQFSYLLLVSIVAAAVSVGIFHCVLGDAERSLLTWHPVFNTATSSRRNVLELPTSFTPIVREVVAVAWRSEGVALLVSLGMRLSVAMCLGCTARKTSPSYTTHVVILYWLNPLLLAQSFSLSVDIIDDFLVALILCVTAVMSTSALKGALLVVLVTAAAVHDPQYVALAGSVLLVLSELCVAHKRGSLILVTALAFGAAAVAFPQVSRSAQTLISARDYVPNFGVFYYMYQLGFPLFHRHLAWVFYLMPCSYIVPLALRLSACHHTMTGGQRCGFIVAITHCLVQLHRPYPALGSLVLSYHLVHAVAPGLSRRMPYGYLFLALLSGSVVMGFVYLDAWLVLRRVNGNYFFFAVLAFVGARIIFVVQTVSQVLLRARNGVLVD